jgi:hypothetical protein
VIKWRMRRPVCVMRVKEFRYDYKHFVGKIKGKISLGIHRHKREDIIKVILK